MKNLPLDCIVVGYNDSSFQEYARRVMLSRTQSGAYHAVLANSVCYRGKRLPYMELLNECIASVTGQSPGLHVCKLPNLGVSYLKNFLKKSDLVVDIVNFFSLEKARLRELLSAGSRSVAITTTFYTTVIPVIEIVKWIRKVDPAVKIIVGGPFIFNTCSTDDRASVDATLLNMGADIYIFDGQGEKTLARVLHRLRGGPEDLGDIPNLRIVERTHGRPAEVKHTAREVENNEMDKYSVDWSHFPREHFVPTVQLRTARSCAFKCAFCCYPIMAGDLNLTSIAVVERELHYLKSCGVKNLVFIDDTFNIPRDRFKEMCRMMIKNDFRFRWVSYFRAGNADDESLALAAESGCVGVFLGLESGDQGILNNMNKAVKVEKYVHAVKVLNSYGVFTFASMIVGFPGETAASVENSIRFIEEAAPAGYRAELYYHSKNTPIHQQAGKYGLSGGGYSWTHSTMNWREAIGHIRQMYRTITSSLIVAEYMFDFWSLPYLLGCGLSMDDYKQFLKAAHPLLVASIEGNIDSSPYEDDLQAFARSLAVTLDREPNHSIR